MSNEEIVGGVNYPSPFDTLVVTLAESAARYIYILSPRLDQDVFDKPDLVSALSELARRSRQTEIRILVSDSRGLVARGHRLLGLARRLPSTVRIQTIEHHPQWKGQTVVIRDRNGLLYKPADANSEAFYQPDSRPETQPYIELFEELWRHSVQDPDLRSINL